MPLRVAPDEKRQLDVRHSVEQAIQPERRALAPRRHVATRPPTRIAETHGNDRDAPRIVEDLVPDPHPGPQALAAGIVPGDAAGMRAQARRVSGDEDSCARISLQHRARAERQFRLASAALANFGQQRMQSGKASGGQWAVLEEVRI
jgi:hypothetical protein